MGLIYSLRDPMNQEIRYIGYTSKSLNRRLCQHISDSNKGRGYWVHHWINQLFVRDICPVISLLETVGSNWKEREQYWIAYGKDNGWNLTNLTDGGEGTIGKHLTDEHKLKLSLAHKGKVSPRKGAKLSDETKAKLSLAHKGIIPSNETRAKMAEVHKGHAYTLGKKLSEDHKRKIGNAGRGRVLSDETRKKISNNHNPISNLNLLRDSKLISENTKSQWVKAHNRIQDI